MLVDTSYMCSPWLCCVRFILIYNGYRQKYPKKWGNHYKRAVHPISSRYVSASLSFFILTVSLYLLYRWSIFKNRVKASYKGKDSFKNRLKILNSFNLCKLKFFRVLYYVYSFYLSAIFCRKLRNEYINESIKGKHFCKESTDHFG